MARRSDDVDTVKRFRAGRRGMHPKPRERADGERQRKKRSMP
jgi:hypothetical protein